jgi:chromosome partitioning protein
VQARPNLDVLPSDKTTEQAKLVLAGMSFREQVLATQLQSLAHYYDVVIIDCAPSVDVLHVSALVAADYLVIPTKLSFLAVDGVSEMLRSVLAIRTSNPDLAPSVICILPTFFERTTRETVAQLRSLTTHFARLVWPPIPVDVKLREAPVFGKTIWEHAPRSRSIVGIETSSNGRRYGGYADFVERLEQYL